MALRVNIFFIFLLFGAIIASILLKPFKTFKAKKEDTPQLRFVSFESFKITKKGVESIGFGSVALKHNKKLIIKSPKFMRQTNKGIEIISANSGEIVEDSYIKLYNFVELRRNDNFAIKTSKMVYDMKTEIYSTKGSRFEVNYGKSIVIGESLRYNQKSGKIFADKIKAKIFEEGR